jgi:PTS system nitrogen regulatory IIA component
LEMKKEKNLNIEDVAALLQIPAEKVERWVQQGQIPCKFKEDRCYFRKKEILDWARTHELMMFDRQEEDKSRDETYLSLKAGIERGGVHFGLEGDDSAALFENAVASMAFPGHISERDVIDALNGREEIASTGIGRGIAIPHPRQPLAIECPLVPVFFLEKSVDFRSVDGKPVSILFFMFSPSTQIHLKLLSKLSFFLRSAPLLEKLKSCRTEKDVLDLIGAFESDLRKSAAS